MELKLRDYQQKHLGKAMELPRCLDYSEPSTGKTAPALVKALAMNRGSGIKTVMLSPSGIMVKNYDEAIAWGFSEEECGLVVGTPEKRKKVYNDDRVQIFFMTYQCFSKEWKLLPKEVDLIIADESHTAWSTHSSATTQNMYMASRRFKHFHLMTGTPITSRLDSIYPFFAIACPRAYGTHEVFMKYHGVFDTFGNIQGWKNHDKIIKLLSHFGFGITIAKAYPNLVENQVFFQRALLDEHQAKKYIEFEKEALVEMDLEDKFLESPNNAVKTLYCRMILSSPKHVGISVPQLGKIEALREHLHESDEQVVVFTVFDEEMDEVEELCKAEGISYTKINGSMNPKKKGLASKEFEDGNVRVMIASVKCCGFGFNWQNAGRLVFMSTTYDYHDLKQCILRGNRGSRKTPLKVYILHYGTKVEKRVFSLIKRKEGNSGKIMQNVP